MEYDVPDSTKESGLIVIQYYSWLPQLPQEIESNVRSSIIRTRDLKYLNIQNYNLQQWNGMNWVGVISENDADFEINFTIFYTINTGNILHKYNQLLNKI
jgi:hypothetical protein